MKPEHLYILYIKLRFIVLFGLNQKEPIRRRRTRPNHLYENIISEGCGAARTVSSGTASAKKN